MSVTYAVVKTGGRQYRVMPGQIIRVDKLDAQVGEKISLSEVLVVKSETDFKVGMPVLAGAVVEATVVEQDRSKKIIVFKKKRRQGYQKKQGHRQDFTSIKIDSISS